MHQIHTTGCRDHPCPTSVLQVPTSCRSWTHCHSTSCLAIRLQPSAPGRRRIATTSWPLTVGIQRNAEKPIIFVHVDDLKSCPGPQDVSWVPNTPTAKSLCASTVAFRTGSHVSDMTSDPSVDVSAWGDESDLQTGSTVLKNLDKAHRLNRT